MLDRLVANWLVRERLLVIGDGLVVGRAIFEADRLVSMVLKIFLLDAPLLERLLGGSLRQWGCLLAVFLAVLDRAFLEGFLLCNWQGCFRRDFCRILSSDSHLFLFHNSSGFSISSFVSYLLFFLLRIHSNFTLNLAVNFHGLFLCYIVLNLLQHFDLSLCITLNPLILRPQLLKLPRLSLSFLFKRLRLSPNLF